MEHRMRLTNYYLACSMTAHLFMETEGVNSFTPIDWIENEGINYVPKISKPHRRTLLHDYIEGVYIMHDSYILDKHFAEALIDEIIDIFDSYNHSNENTIKLIKEYLKLQEEDGDYTKFDCLGYKFHDELCNNLLGYIVEDIFTVLFQNKAYMKKFNLQLSELVSELKCDINPDVMEKDGVLKRSDIPEWLKKGVFLRDKGRCQLCGTDLTGLLNTDKKIYHDHIVPLELGGTNDPTNFQLICSVCNHKKGDRYTDTTASLFWDIE